MSDLPVHSATCVAIDGRAVLIEGPPGIGKSSLALALIDRGAKLVGDDGVALEPRNGALWAHPVAKIRGKLEIRGVGLVDLDPVDAGVALRIILDKDAPRFIERAVTSELLGCMIPTLSLYPASASLPLRTEWALRVHGLGPIQA